MTQEELRESELTAIAEMMIEIVKWKGRYKFMSERKIISWEEVMYLLDIDRSMAKESARIAKKIDKNFGYGILSITYKEMVK